MNDKLNLVLAIIVGAVIVYCLHSTTEIKKDMYLLMKQVDVLETEIHRIDKNRLRRFDKIFNEVLKLGG